MSDFPNQNVTPTQSTDRIFAVLAHIGGIFFWFIPALVVYLIKKDEPNGQFDADQAKEALNFQITLTIGYFVSALLMLVLIGILTFWLLALGNLILSIVAAVKANGGVAYRYPLTLRLIK